MRPLRLPVVSSSSYVFSCRTTERGGGSESVREQAARRRAPSASGPYPAGVNPSFRAESRSSDSSLPRRLPDRNQWPKRVAVCIRPGGAGCRNLQQRELFGTCTRFPFHPCGAGEPLRRRNSRRCKSTKNFPENGHSAKICVRVRPRWAGHHSARCQPAAPCSGQPPS